MDQVTDMDMDMDMDIMGAVTMVGWRMGIRIMGAGTMGMDTMGTTDITGMGIMGRGGKCRLLAMEGRRGTAMADLRCIMISSRLLR